MPTVSRLLATTGAADVPDLADSVAAGTVGAVTRTVLSGGDMSRALAEQMQAGGMQRALEGSTTLLVATHPDQQQPVRMCLTMPPGGAMHQAMSVGATSNALMMMLMGLRKLSAVAVDPEHRRAGLGQALVATAVSMAFRTGAMQVFGETSVEDGLQDWYTRQGFTVLAPQEGLDLQWLIDIPLVLSAVPREQMFAATADGKPVPISDGSRPRITLPRPLRQALRRGGPQ
jgi:GNAT superfamily N-acetyltransferase